MTELTPLVSAGGDAAAIADLAERASSIDDQFRVINVDDGPILLRRPEGMRVELLNPEEHSFTPYRKRGHVAVTDVESLCLYVNAQKGTGTTLWADRDAGKIVAVLDDHDDDVAGWGDHRATMRLRATPDWTLWTKYDGQLIGQSDFAELIEQGAGAIIRPAAAEMLELAQSFHAARSVTFKSGQRLQSGETQLMYDEVIDAQAGRSGQIRIPETFELGLAPFEGTDAFKLEARLRYRLNGPKLTIGYKLIRPDELVRQAFETVLGAVTEKTEITPHNGSPRSER